MNNSAGLLDFAALDGIAFAVERGKLDSTTLPRLTAHDIGPFLELSQLAEAGRLPYPCKAGGWLAPGRLDTFALALVEGHAQWLSGVDRRAGFMRTSAHPDESAWTAFGLAAQQAAVNAGFQKPMVKRMNKRRHRASGTPLSAGLAPNELWCADYKGEFQLGNRAYCYPLTVTDHASRYLLLCEALESTREELAFTAFERLFQERGLPRAIRSDNGVPFASPNALFNLSKLSVWWLRLGIGIERIKPGKPQQNGRHERRHLTLKKEATRPPEQKTLQPTDNPFGPGVSPMS